MSHTEPSSPGIENPCADVCESRDDGTDESSDRDTKVVGNDSNSPDRNARQRVLKEVGLTSTAFIGPAFPPEATRVKTDLEDTLSEFYRELEENDTPDGANDNPRKQDVVFGQPPIPPKTFTSKETQDVSQEKMVQPAETDGFQKSSGQKQPSWPHWYQNEPYYLRRPRPDMDLNSGRAAPTQNQMHYSQTLSRQPNPRFHRPPFHRPPPPSAFPNPQNSPSYLNHNQSSLGMTNQYQDELPPDVCSHPSQGFYGDSPHHFYRHERGFSYDAHLTNVNVGWSRDRKEEWFQLGEDYDRGKRYDSENEQWEHHCQPPDNIPAYHSSLVLILMRGLPGSGKSTLARELLSTGPSGLILSTDDYFAHRAGYCYEPGLLGAAHEWNQRRANDAMHDGRSPIIIDNTNIQAWEMKPYVKMALERGYQVDFCEPDTSWKFDPYELEKRNKHGVPQEKIAQMRDRFSFPVSIDIVMGSQEPPHVNQRRRPVQPQMMRKNKKFH